MDAWYFSAAESAVFHDRMRSADMRELRTTKEALESYCAQGYHMKDRYQAVKKELDKRMERERMVGHA